MISHTGARQSGAEGFGEVMSSLSRPEPLTAPEEAALASLDVERGAGVPDLAPVMGVVVRLAAIQAGAIPLKEAAARLGVNDSRLWSAP